MAAGVSRLKIYYRFKTEMSLVTSAAANSMKWNAANYAANSVVQQTWARELIARLALRGDEHV